MTEDAPSAPGDELQTARARLVRLLHLRHLGLDPAVKKYRANEASTGGALEHVVGERLERVVDGAGDWRGTRSRRIYDDCSPAKMPFFDKEEWLASLKRHLVLYDLVSVDLRGRSLTDRQTAQVVEALNALPAAQKRKVLVLVDEEI